MEGVECPQPEHARNSTLAFFRKDHYSGRIHSRYSSCGRP